MIHDQGPSGRYLQRFLEVPEGWVSDLDISWRLGGEDVVARREVRRIVGKLTRSGALQRIFISHHQEPLGCVLIDHDAIRSVIAGEK
jgi:hypothetical protein